MTKKPGRIVQVHLPDASQPVPAGGVQALEAAHADGLAIFRLAAMPGERITAPAPSAGGGQYVLVTSGSVRNGADTLPARSCAFVSPDDAALELVAGADGFNAVMVQFPRQSWQTRLASLH